MWPVASRLPLSGALARLVGDHASSAAWLYVVTLLRLHPWRVAGALALMAGVGLTQGIGLLLLVPLLQAAGIEVQYGGVGRVSAAITFVFASLGVPPTLLAALLVYVVLIGAHALLARWQSVLSTTISQQVAARLRRQLYGAVANMQWRVFSRHRASDFAHALTMEPDRVAEGTEYLLGLVANALIVLVYVALAFRLSPLVTAITVACGAGIWVVFRRRVSTAHEYGQELSAATGELYGAADEHLGNLKIAKSYNRERDQAGRFGRIVANVARSYADATRSYSGAKLWFELASIGVLCLILYVALELLEIPIAEVVLLLFVFFRLMPKVSGLQQSYQQFLHMLPAFAALVALIRTCEAAADAENADQPAVELQRTLALDGVTFAYAESGAPAILRDLTLAIQAGETAAIVGPSGAGKSTVADLVMGLLVPQQGRLVVDGRALEASCLRGWRQGIGYVTQETLLFHDTIRANLLWACPDADATALEDALRAAAAWEFVRQLPDGLDTVVGDRGMRLSGGERQRLALARALVRRPSLLILDEATSSLDTENERRIQEAIERLHGRMTILVITHRLSTIRGADVIYVLERGRVVEAGSWDTLLARPAGRLRALCAAQGLPGLEASAPRSMPPA